MKPSNFNSLGESVSDLCCIEGTPNRWSAFNFVISPEKLVSYILVFASSFVSPVRRTAVCMHTYVLATKLEKNIELLTRFVGT